jgi:hypothetical protein
MADNLKKKGKADRMKKSSQTWEKKYKRKR